jgi:hypothetical protein
MDEAKPLRIVANWRNIGGSAMKAMLLCASPYQCKDNEDLARLLQQHYGFYRPKIFTRDYDTHDELHAILRHGTAPDSPLRIEIAVECGEDMPKNV